MFEGFDAFELAELFGAFDEFPVLGGYGLEDFEGDASDIDYYLNGSEDYGDIAADGERCPSCRQFWFAGGFTGEVIECPLCGFRAKL